MQAQPKIIREILHTGEQYIIPLFQRYYSWEKKHWERLRKDIWALMDNGAKPVHFLGPLVCTQPPRLPGSNSAFQLIDGQQRITTLTILLAAIRDVARSRNLNDLAEEVTESYLLYKRKIGTDRYKVLPRLGDREVLTAVIEGHALENFTDSRVFEAWKYFHRHVEHWARKDTERQLSRLMDAVSTRLSLVVVLIDAENPYEIFESLNSTGLPLKQSDLIRNFIFMQIPLSKQQEFSDQHWKAFEAMFDATNVEPEVEMTPFYRDYLMRGGQYSKEDATFMDFKQSYAGAGLNPEAAVNELKHYAKLELMLCRPISVRDPDMRSVLRQVNGMDITTAYSLVLNLLDRNDRGQLSKDELCGCLQDLVSFVLRRSICGESTRAYSRWFVEAISVIRDNPRRDLQNYWLARRWPDDEALRQRLVDFAIYRREGGKTRVILETIEESFGHREPVDLSSLSVEHVMPQTISNSSDGKSWKEMLGENWEKIHERWLHTIGNLTLTGYNTSLSNSAFPKKQVLLSQSHLDLNLHFKDLPKWDADAIQVRTAALAARMIGLWPRPTSEVRYAASEEALPQPEGLTNAEKGRLEYWRQMDARLEERGMQPELIIPTSNSSINIPLGSSGAAELVLSMNQQRGQIYVSLVFAHEIGEKIARDLQREKAAVEQELGCTLSWEIGRHWGEIYVADEDIQIRDRDDWPVQHDWFGDRLEDFLRVFVSRVTKFEQQALLDPALKQSVGQREQLVEYWRACSTALAGSALAFREGQPDIGRKYCHFPQLDTGITLGVQYYSTDLSVCIYIGVYGSAGRKQRAICRDLQENHLVELGAQIGETLNWTAPYFWVATPADIGVKSDWARQHKWVRDTAEKLVATFKSRLGID